MKSITTTYPGFHDLPKGIKQMLLESESFFFAEARSIAQTGILITGFPLQADRYVFQTQINPEGHRLWNPEQRQS